ncbi:hypothetical protein DPMN_076327 [Dreissena polymorpha]|uniref:Uncharacterized protein n=1 Tax=Dreissena polymorpha TaxID=45954 RepID=A0A9D4BNA4_DREPO|nr:hypothetical protein DPMN_076327 [Dreissena polymorpha]
MSRYIGMLSSCQQFGYPREVPDPNIGLSAHLSPLGDNGAQRWRVAFAVLYNLPVGYSGLVVHCSMWLEIEDEFQNGRRECHCTERKRVGD